MQGYFYSEEQTLIDDTRIKIGILSRRQCRRGGTRLNARGIDDDGYVGNYVETETFMILNNSLYIQTQIRGSVPLFWKQEGLKGAVKFKRPPLNSIRTLMKHFRMVQRYVFKKHNPIMFDNCMKKVGVGES